MCVCGSLLFLIVRLLLLKLFEDRFIHVFALVSSPAALIGSITLSNVGIRFGICLCFFLLFINIYHKCLLTRPFYRARECNEIFCVCAVFFCSRSHKIALSNSATANLIQLIFIAFAGQRTSSI